MASTPGFEPGPHWWEASALTTATSLAPPALGPIVHVQALVGLGNLIIIAATSWGKPSELHVVLNSALSRCSLDLVASEALAVNLSLKSWL